MSTVRLPLFGAPLFRSGADSTKDQRFINCYPESIENPETQVSRYFVLKRPGLKVNLTFSISASDGRGVIYWPVTGKTYSVFGNTLYSNTTAIRTLTTSTGVCGFCEIAGSTTYLFLVDGTHAYRIDSSDTVARISPATWQANTAYVVGDAVAPTVANNHTYKCTVAGISGGSEPVWPTTNDTTKVDNTVTWITKALVSFPTPHVPQPIFFDGYVFLMKTDGSIFNSGLQDVTSWASTDYISADMYPDKSVALARQSNQLVAFGQSSVEFFYDAANASGSPLGKTTQAALQIGIAGSDTVAQSDGLLMFVAQSTSGGRYVAGIEGLKIQPVSNEAIDRVLYDEQSNIDSAWGRIVRIGGHLFYMLSLTSSSRTFVYDIQEKVWHEWQSGSSIFTGKFFTNSNGKVLVQPSNGLKIYEFDSQTYQDDSVAINLTIQTSKFDGDSNNRKFLHKLTLVGDRYTSSNPVTISWSDNDYQTYPVSRTTDLQYRSFVTRLGSFRRRAFKITHNANQPFRIELVELDIDEGSH